MPPINTSKIKITSNILCKNQVCWVNNIPKTKLNNGIIISFHGGAYVAGNAESCLPYLVPLCKYTNMTGLSIGYKLAPESPLPIQIEESYQIYKYLLNELKCNHKSIALIGDSAGGSLVILLLQKIAKECKDKMPACGITLSSWDVPSEGESYIKNLDKDSLLDQTAGRIWGEMAVGNIDKDGNMLPENEQKNLNDEEYSYLSGNFNGFPPLLLTMSEWECVSDDSIRVKEECDKIGVSVTLKITKNCGLHVLEDLQGYDIPEAKELIQTEGKFILEHINA